MKHKREAHVQASKHAGGDPRYASGTCLTKTKKEEQIDSLETEMQAEFSDQLAIALRKLTIAQIIELRKHNNARSEGFIEAFKT